MESRLIMQKMGQILKCLQKEENKGRGIVPKPDKISMFLPNFID